MLGGGDWRKGMRLLRPAGRLVAYGFANMSSGERRSLANVARQLLRVPRFTPLGLMDRNVGVAGVNMGHLWQQLPMLRQELDELARLWRAGALRPRVVRPAARLCPQSSCGNGSRLWRAQRTRCSQCS